VSTDIVARTNPKKNALRTLQDHGLLSPPDPLQIGLAIDEPYLRLLNNSRLREDVAHTLDDALFRDHGIYAECKVELAPLNATNQCTLVYTNPPFIREDRMSFRSDAERQFFRLARKEWQRRSSEDRFVVLPKLQDVVGKSCAE